VIIIGPPLYPIDDTHRALQWAAVAGVIAVAIQRLVHDNEGYAAALRTCWTKRLPSRPSSIVPRSEQDRPAGANHNQLTGLAYRAALRCAKQRSDGREAGAQRDDPANHDQGPGAGHVEREDQVTVRVTVTTRWYAPLRPVIVTG
jgi:hypothetical protein